MVGGGECFIYEFCIEYGGEMGDRIYILLYEKGGGFNNVLFDL